MAENTTPKKIAADLDSATRDETPDTLLIKIGGQAVEFNDPIELEYRLLDRINNPETFAKYCVADGSREHFKAQKLPAWKFRKLSDLYMEHYKVDELMGN